MFDIGMSEIMVVAVVTLVVIGPRDLPRTLQSIGRWVGKARAMASEFHRHVDDMVHEAELDEFRRKAAELNRKSLANVIEDTVDPSGSLRRGLQMEDFDDASDYPGHGRTAPITAAAPAPPPDTAPGTQPVPPGPDAPPPPSPSPPGTAAP